MLAMQKNLWKNSVEEELYKSRDNNNDNSISSAVSEANDENGDEQQPVPEAKDVS